MRRTAGATAIAGLARLVSLAALVAFPSVSTADPGDGHLLLNGGGGEGAAYWQKLFALAGGKDRSIVILPTASERPEAGSEYVEELRAAGATNVRALELRRRDDASRPDFLAALRAAHAVFFTGGDQSRITAAILDTPAAEAIRAVYDGGGVLAGSSAGLACMSERMLTGEGDFGALTAGNVELVRGLGYVTEAIVDQHFVARGRANRLLSVVLEHPELLGLGVDERTAIDVGPDRTLEVSGEGWVLVLDARSAKVRREKDATRGGATRLAADAVTLRVLVAGDRLDLATGALLPRR